MSEEFDRPDIEDQLCWMTAQGVHEPSAHIWQHSRIRSRFKLDTRPAKSDRETGSVCRYLENNLKPQ